MLTRFVKLRAEVQGASLFECKTSDFVGFMAAVVLILALSGMSDIPNPRNSDKDLYLIRSMDSILHKEERENGCKIASQCRKTLQMLSGIQSNDSSNAESSVEPHQISIPYFGTVVRRRVKQVAAQNLLGNAHGTSPGTSFSPSTLQESATNFTMEQNPLAYEHTIEYGGYNPSLGIPSSIHHETDSFGNFPTDDLSTWLDTAMMDIDQDWSMLLDTYDVSSQGFLMVASP
jgi:hypothetical protein